MFMEEIRLEITNLGMNVEGVARKDGKVFFVPYALPEEVVKVKILEEKPKFNKCELIEVEKPSKERVVPFCPYFFKCGGCDLQLLPYSKQLSFKQKHIKETIEKICGEAVEVLQPISSSNSFYYRNKGVFPVSNNIGMFEGSSHNVIDIKQCFLMKDEITTAYQIAKDFLKEFNIKGYDFKLNKGNVKYIAVRTKGDTTLVCLVVKTKVENLNVLYERLTKKLNKVGLYLNYYNDKSKDILSENFEYISGEKDIEISEFGITYRINLSSFMQVNDYIKEKLYLEVLNEIDNEIVIDAYAGAGLLSAMISKRAKKVYSIEIVKPASEYAKRLQKLNNIDNMEVVNGDCALILPKLSKTLKNDFVAVIDPARSGCDDRVLGAISKAKKIVYVSCNPITLSRDLKTLLATHKIEKIQPFDMFPNTKHVETLVVLTKKSSEN